MFLQHLMSYWDIVAPPRCSFVPASPQRCGVRVCVCGQDGRGVRTQPALHFLCSKTSGGAGDSERGAGRRGWRGGAARCHPQGSAAAGGNKKTITQGFCISMLLTFTANQLDWNTASYLFHVEIIEKCVPWWIEPTGWMLTKTSRDPGGSGVDNKGNGDWERQRVEGKDGVGEWKGSDERRDLRAQRQHETKLWDAKEYGGKTQGLNLLIS